MTRYTFYIAKRKLTCEYVDKYNKLYILEDEEALECLDRVSKFKYKKIDISEEVASFTTQTTEVIVEDYNRILKKYKNEKLMLLIVKQNIINKISHLITPSKIFILYVPIIITSLKLYNLTKNNDLYAEGIEKTVIEQFDEPISEENYYDVDVIAGEYNNEFDNNIYNINIDCYEKGESDDTNYVINQYGHIIDKLSKRYGISPNLITGMVTQESHGVHENLMQVVFDLNNDYISKIYNFEKNKYDTIVLTDSPEEYPDVDIIITSDMMREPYYAILAGINAFRINLDQYSKNNICSAICCYNKGYGNWTKVLNETSKYTRTSIDDILSNPSNISFIPYDDNLKIGDPHYLENVLQYVPNAEEGIYIKTIDASGNIDKIKLCVNKTLGKVNVK